MRMQTLLQRLQSEAEICRILPCCSLINHLYRQRLVIYDFIKKNNENEQKYLKEITETIIELKKIEKSTKENIKLIHQSNLTLNKFIKLNDVYPKLNKNKNYNEFLEQIQLNLQRLNYAFDIYDKEVTIYNQQKQTKINSIISKIFKIKDYEQYNK